MSSGFESDDGGSVIFVPYVKPKPLVIVLDDSDDDYGNPRDSSSTQTQGRQKVSLSTASKPATGVIKPTSNERAPRPVTSSSVSTVEPNTSKRQRSRTEESARNDKKKNECNEGPQKKLKGLSEQKFGSKVTLLDTTEQKAKEWKDLLAERRRERERVEAAVREKSTTVSCDMGTVGAENMDRIKKPRIKYSRQQKKNLRKLPKAERRAEKKKIQLRNIRRRDRRRKERLEKQLEQESVEEAAALSKTLEPTNVAYDTAMMGMPKAQNLEKAPSNKKLKLAEYRANMKLLNETRRKNRDSQDSQTARHEQEPFYIFTDVPEKPTNATRDTAKMVPEDENFETQQSNKKLKLAEYRANMKLLNKIRRQNYQNRSKIQQLKQKMSEVSGTSEAQQLANSEGSPPLALVVDQLAYDQHSDAGNSNGFSATIGPELGQVSIPQHASPGTTEDSPVPFGSTSSVLETLPTDAPESSWNWLDGNGNPVLLHDFDQRSAFQQTENLWTICIPLHLPPPGYPEHPMVRSQGPPVQNWFIASNTGAANPAYVNPFANAFFQPHPHLMITHQQQSFVSTPPPQQVVQMGMVPAQPTSIFAVGNDDASEVQNLESLYTRRPRRPTP